eukprot:108458_1
MQTETNYYLVILLLASILAVNGADCENDICYNQENSNFGSDPFIKSDECNSLDSPPDIISYHLHVAFNGNDKKSISFAYQQYHNFINYINKHMNVCTFAHSYVASNKEQTKICYFPTPWQENDFPIISNPILGSSNYAFFIPLSYLHKTLHFFFRHHNDYVLHSVSGCQINDHSKWMMISHQFSGNFTANNLLCCHHGPPLCTCDIVQYEINNGLCLGIQYDKHYNTVFVASKCETMPFRSLGSWREVTYDENKRYLQIENFGNVIHPIYMCLGIERDDICQIGSEIQLLDCSYKQNVSNNLWISNATQFMYDKDLNQIRVIGCYDGNLCVNVNNVQDEKLKLTATNCENATVFSKRHFFP